VEVSQLDHPTGTSALPEGSVLPLVVVVVVVVVVMVCEDVEVGRGRAGEEAFELFFSFSSDSFFFFSLSLFRSPLPSARRRSAVDVDESGWAGRATAQSGSQRNRLFANEVIRQAVDDPTSG